MNEMVEALSDALQQLLEQGFEVPIHLAVIAKNGASMSGTYSLIGSDLKFKSHHQQGGGFMLPINIMLVDSRGEAARLLIGNDEPELTLH
jgi:hypothetical protein